MSHRAKALARIADPTLPRKVHRDDNTVTDDFLHSKRDKLTIRKASFRARVTEKLADRGRLPGAKALKRRRPSKKLVATLASLADALPDVASTSPEDDEAKRRRRQTSLKTRPGSMKRKEKVVQAEMARFGLNLAQLTAVKEDVVDMEVEATERTDTKDTKDTDKTEAAPRQSTANRFAMLRSYITATMDQSPAFAKQE